MSRLVTAARTVETRILTMINGGISDLIAVRY